MHVRGGAIGVGLAIALLLPQAAIAELKDYQIARMIMLKTECQLEDLKRNVREDGSVQFKATCKNISFYPDGVTITCPDIDENDERTCAMDAKKKSFDSLKLLQGAQ